MVRPAADGSEEDGSEEDGAAAAAVHRAEHEGGREGEHRVEAPPGQQSRRSPVRTLLITGPGGAGRTTVAAASALAEARGGMRTLLLSGEPPAVLAPVLGLPQSAADAASGASGASPAAAGPVEVSATEGRLWVARIDSGEQFRSGGSALQERLRPALGMLGAEALDEDELTELPGAEAFALLRTLRAAHTVGAWDTLVVDLPSTPAALQLLALPGQLRRYLRRLLPPERQAARALRPALAQLVGVPMPTAALYGTTAHWERELAAVEEMLEAPGTSVRLVAEPGTLPAEALRLARAGVGLYGLPLGAVMANRLLPLRSSDPWLAALSARQQDVLGALRAECETQDVPLVEVPHLGRDPLGVDDLEHIAAAAGLHEAGAGPGGGSGRDAHVENRLAQEGLLVWHLPLPAVRKDELDLVRRGDELILSAGPYRRVVALPSALRRCRVAGAALEQGVLRVRCEPDPALWPEEPRS
ncbi:ArsA family ATPase [Streptomyces ovatisporus]|uniref:ArsA family ATPase n=1 Tax=Streptomyces ovatisporus TaxID=1128682 RepID=A0ABV9AIS0_9ACTN